MHYPGPRRDGYSASDLSITADEVTCRQFVELVTDYFEDALGPRALSRVEEHLVICDWCVTYAQQMHATIASLHELRAPAPSEPSGSVLAALRARKGAST